MRDLLFEIVSLPDRAIYAIAAVLAGAIFGGLAVLVLGRKSKMIGVAIVVGCATSSIVLKNYLPAITNYAATDKTVDVMIKEMRLAQTVFKIDPTAEERFRAQLHSALDTAPLAQVRGEARRVSSEFFGAYLAKYMPMASQDSMYRLIARQKEVLNAWKADPASCLAYYSGQGSPDPALFTKEFQDTENDLRAAVIESAVVNPSPPSANVTFEEVTAPLIDAYEAKAYDVANLDKLQDLGTLAPDEGCRMAFEFVDVLQSMEEERSVFVFKGLLVLGAQQQQ